VSGNVDALPAGDDPPSFLDVLALPDEDGIIPVRAMEGILARGSEAVGPLRQHLERSAEPESYNAYWTAVLLGELRDAAAIPELAAAVARAAPDHVLVPFAAAGALGAIGDAALPAVREILERGEPHVRQWAYLAAARLGTPPAVELLLERLESDAELLDVIANALAEAGGAEHTERLLAAAARAEPWQIPDIEGAIAVLNGAGVRSVEPRDWRLRYRPDPGVGPFPLHWSTIGAVVRQELGVRRGRAQKPRSLEAILAEAREADREPCDCCGAREWQGTGVPVCPALAAEIPERQALMVEELADRIESDDLWEVLDELEYSIFLADERRRRRGSRRDRERAEHNLTGLRVLRGGVVWSIEQGIESAAAGARRLRQEAAAAEDEHGRPEVEAPPVQAAAPRIGRNEPCPCGSGKKFKRCCG
jgi:hypothetical protein